jgi:hypothetical protein
MRLIRGSPTSHVDPLDVGRTIGLASKPTAGGRPLGSHRGLGPVVASGAGVVGAAAVAASHGNEVLAVTVFLCMQIWGIFELACRWRLKWRMARLQEDIARKAMENPGNADLRTLMADVAATYLDEIGTRLPLRPQIIDKPSVDG